MGVRRAAVLLQSDLLRRVVKHFEDRQFITDTLSHGDTKFMVCSLDLSSLCYLWALAVVVACLITAAVKDHYVLHMFFFIYF